MARDGTSSSELKLENRNWAAQLPASVDLHNEELPCAQCVWLWVMKLYAWHEADDASWLTRDTFHPDREQADNASEANDMKVYFKNVSCIVTSILKEQKQRKIKAERTVPILRHWGTFAVLQLLAHKEDSGSCSFYFKSVKWQECCLWGSQLLHVKWPGQEPEAGWASGHQGEAGTCLCVGHSGIWRWCLRRCVGSLVYLFPTKVMCSSFSSPWGQGDSKTEGWHCFQISVKVN